MTTEGDTATGSASLFTKMARVMGKMSRIEKDGTHPTQHYKFVTDADVLDKVRVAMAEENLALLPSMVEVVSEKIGETQYKNPIMRHVARFVFTFADGDTGATYSCVWHGECNDTSDKGISKAATAALKYFLLKTFLISTGDIADDPDHQEDVQQKPATTKKQQPATPKLVPTPNGGAKADVPNGANGNGERRMASTPAPAEADAPYTSGRTWLPDLETELGIRGHKLNRNHLMNVIKLLKGEGVVSDDTTFRELIGLIVAREEAKELPPAV